ncbi:MAG: methionyl-tRNA formyltransferase [Ignavibacteriales bacterium]|nr:methionyl-tRNA formyltransferase [Ignavibacteriales bacterium]
MGTPDFAVPSLKILLESKHSVEAVVTAPDKERGRGRQVTFTPVKQFALEKNLKVFTPERLRDENFVNAMKEIQPDLFVVVAFRILPHEIFAIPKFGSFNLHGSLLPKYRGAAPIQWAIINGEIETGVTTFFLDEKVDTGNIILQEKMMIDEKDNLGTVHDKMMMLGAELVLKTVEQISDGTVKLSKQEDSLATPAPKITKEVCEIKWNKSAVEIHNLVRGLSPYPCAYFVLNGKHYKVFRTKIVTESMMVNVKFGSTINFQPTTNNIQLTPKEIFIKTGNGILQILELQPEGRKRMTAEEFLRGYKF